MFKALWQLSFFVCAYECSLWFVEYFRHHPVLQVKWRKTWFYDNKLFCTALGQELITINGLLTWVGFSKQEKPSIFSVPFNNMRTLKFKAQPTNSFFALVNQMFGGFSQLPTTAEHARNQIVEHSSDNETVFGSSRKLEGAAQHSIDGIVKNVFLNFKVRMFLKAQ